eukprot:6122457-Pyramimonas_sp.AAC.1
MYCPHCWQHATTPMQRSHTGHCKGPKKISGGSGEEAEVLGRQVLLDRASAQAREAAAADSEAEG